MAIVDADFNGPTQARMTGLRGAVPVPGVDGIALPKSRDGVASSRSARSCRNPRRSISPPSAAASRTPGGRRGVRRARRGPGLGRLGKLDVLLFDLPPGAERTLQFAEYLGRGDVVRARHDSLGSLPWRRRALGRCAGQAPTMPVLGYVENMSGYFCADCGEVKPLFPEAKDGIVLDLPCLGRVPFDPALAFALRSGRGVPRPPETAATRALSAIAGRLDGDHWRPAR